MEKIDAVYTWCDDSDVSFLAEKENYLNKEHIVISSTETSRRFENHDELKYSIRSLQKYAPWINHIFIVTNKQTPHWFKNTDKITIVDHKEIIPEKFLPTFNSICIERYLLNIPNLSEKFIYLNDDLFFNKKTKPSDFFYNGKPIVRLNMPIPPFEYREVDNQYDRTILNAYEAFIHHNHSVFNLLYPTHGIDSYSISMLKDINDKYPEFDIFNTSHFRTEKMIQRVIYLYEMGFIKGSKILKYNYNINKIKKFFIVLLRQKYYYCMDIYQQYDNLRKKINLIKFYSPICFCLNDLDKDGAIIAIKYLKKRFRTPSECEK